VNIQKIILNFFDQAQQGSLRLVLPDGSRKVYGDTQAAIPAELTIHHSAFFRKVALRSDIGLGQSYIDGDWDSRDPSALLRWFIQNRRVFDSSRFRWAMPLISKLAAVGEFLEHRRNANTKAGSQRNIEAHYDLGNDFYSLFLDPSMTYSAAYFNSPEIELEEAQAEKYERICRKLNFKEEDRVLEIGCGWGGFAAYAARHYGCHVTGITLSPSQFDYAEARIAREGLQDKVALKQLDYRDLDGQFDKIVSIEMIEAVGHENLPAYFGSIDRLLAPSGLSCIQIIMTADNRYESYRKSSDFIRKFIFPGSHLPSISSVFEAKGRADMSLYHFESFGLHYARTLELWRERFEENWPKIRSLGFKETFRRKWRLYFDYCIAGFRERHINVGQIVLGRMNSSEYAFEAFEEPMLKLAGQNEQDDPFIADMRA